MFVGHYGPSFAAKKTEPSVPLWVLFIAVQFLDILWAPLVLLGIEKVRIVRHFTASNALDLYYIPYTHGLLAALFWSLFVGVLYRFVVHPSRRRASVLVESAVLLGGMWLCLRGRPARTRPTWIYGVLLREAS
jgi:hypothetical protein